MNLSKNSVLILVAFIGVLSAISVALVGLYQNKETNSLTREQKALDLAELILSEDDDKRRKGEVKLSILYRSDPQGEKDILSRIHRFSVDSEKTKMILGPDPSTPKYLDQANATIVSKDGSGDYLTIREAIDGAKKQELIIIKSGIYYENDLNFPSDGITVRGESKQATIVIGTTGEPVFIPSSNSRIENITVISEKYEIPYYRKTVIWVSGVDGVVISNNIFRGGGTGITISNRNTKKTSVVLSSNIIEKYYYAGVYIENAIVDISFNILSNGIASEGAFVLTDTSDGHIRNNTIVNSGSGIHSGDTDKMGIRFYNNIIMNNKTGVNVPRYQMEVRNNILWNNKTNFWDWNAGDYPGEEYEEEKNIIIDPMLNNIGLGDYSLSEGSPAIGSGIGGVEMGAVNYSYD